MKLRVQSLKRNHQSLHALRHVAGVVVGSSSGLLSVWNATPRWSLVNGKS